MNIISNHESQEQRPYYSKPANEKAWETARAALTHAEIIHNEVSEEDSDVTYQILAATTRAMFETPSPNGAALWFKLDKLFAEKAVEEDGDSKFCPSWTMEWVMPVMDDARRFLGGK